MENRINPSIYQPQIFTLPEQYQTQIRPTIYMPVQNQAQSYQIENFSPQQVQQNTQGNFIERIDQRLLQFFGAVAQSQGQGTSINQFLSAAQLLANMNTTQFTGSVNTPNTIGGIPVIGSTYAEDGSQAFMLADGEIASQSDLVMSSNVQSALTAISILSSDANTKDKALALAQLGINAGVANDVISEVNAGKLGAAFNVFNTITNWSDMTNEQRIASTIQSANTVIGAFSQGGLTGAIPSSISTSFSSSSSSVAGTSVGSSAGSTATAALSGVAGAAGIVMGIDQAADVIDALGDMPRGSEAIQAGAIGLGTAGAAIGAGVGTIAVAASAATAASGAAAGATAGSVVPVVGTIIGGVLGAAAGALLGAFGSSKSKTQMMRDKWRDAMEQMGIADKIDGSHHLTLADGSLYNVGKDGGYRLQNVDGTDRLTTQVDSSNPLTPDAIPESHVFALATGIDPTTNMSEGMWDTVAAQGLNAAMSNATSAADVSANFRAMLEKGGIDPRQVAMRIEVLRVRNKITEEEYQVYLNKVNNIFNTQLIPTDRAKAHMAIVQQISNQPEIAEADKELLLELTDPVKYQGTIESLEQRLSKRAELDQRAIEEKAQAEMEARLLAAQA